MIKKLIRKILLLFFILIISLIGVIVICNLTINRFSEEFIYSNINQLPTNKAGLVLGTSRYVKGGRENLFYKYRLEAAKKLYDAKKVEYLILSGDNSEIYYNEPQTMKNDLVALGISEKHIYLDYAGFRTLDAVVRAKEIFDQKKITIISQDFHNRRAVYIARSKDIDAIAYNAQDVDMRYGFKTRIRELFARVKVFIDLYVTGKQPKFLGEKIKID